VLSRIAAKKDSCKAAPYVILCCAVLFSLVTVYIQVSALHRIYLSTVQLPRLANIIEGRGGAPWQYRIFSEYLVHWTRLAVTKLGLPYPIETAFILFRVAQNTLIFLLAAVYYRKLGLSTYVTLIGLSLLAWGMMHCLYDSDLSFNTYSDVIFYLLAAVLIMSGKYWWIIPTMFLATLNRETSVFIPGMLLVYGLYSESRHELRSKIIPITVASYVVFLTVFLGLRHIYAPQLQLTPYGHALGLDVFMYNVSRPVTWLQVTSALGILPIMALYSIRRWPVSLKSYFWAVVPVSFVAHWFFSITAEARLFLVPFALAFIPGALFGIPDRVKEAAPAPREESVSPVANVQ